MNTLANRGEKTIETNSMDNLDQLYTASQWQLIRKRFRRHKLAMSAMMILIVLYILAIFAHFFSPHDPNKRSLPYRQAPPQKLHFFTEGRFHLRPYVYPLTSQIDMETFQNVYREDRRKKYPIYFFVRGYKYRLGLWETDLHLFGTGIQGVPVHLFGTDELGRDLFGRILYGARISLSIGLIGVFFNLFLGVFIGGIAGYYGGIVDEIIQRLIELIKSIPTLPLWMALSAALPTGWSQLQVYFAITLILSLISWTDLARVVRGKFLSLRNEDYVVAAQLAGRNQLEIIFLHLVPAFMSHIIASLTLSIPGMILGETSLSFLGIGLRAPTISWGVLLQKAQNVNTIAMTPWLMIPGIFVIITVLSFNFLGDGLRDAADPYAHF